MSKVDVRRKWMTKNLLDDDDNNNNDDSDHDEECSVFEEGQKTEQKQEEIIAHDELMMSKDGAKYRWTYQKPYVQNSVMFALVHVY